MLHSESSDIACKAFSVGTRFMEALDNSDWVAAEALLHSDCEYHFRDKILRGVQSIVGSYRKADEWAKSTFESVEYESRVLHASNSECLIAFFDRIRHRGDTLLHECHQSLAVDDSGAIVKIVHIDLPGESEAAKAFNLRHGVAR